MNIAFFPIEEAPLSTLSNSLKMTQPRPNCDPHHTFDNPDSSNRIATLASVTFGHVSDTRSH